MQRDLSSPDLWLRSLLASQERRLECARRERRERRERRRRRRRSGGRGVVVAVCSLTVMAAGAFAHDGGAPKRASTTSVYLDRGDRGAGVRDLQRALGIGVDGVFGPRTDRAVRAFQKRNGLTVDGIAGPITLRALGLGRGTGGDERKRTSERKKRSSDRASTPERSSKKAAPGGKASPQRAGGTPGAQLQAIAQCESGGNPRAVSPSGRYRGKYQFSRETWRGLGGEGDPAAAPETEQDRRAAALYEQSGASPWPSCAG